MKTIEKWKKVLFDELKNQKGLFIMQKLQYNKAENKKINKEEIHNTVDRVIINNTPLTLIDTEFIASQRGNKKLIQKIYIFGPVPTGPLKQHFVDTEIPMVSEVGQNTPYGTRQDFDPLDPISRILNTCPVSDNVFDMLGTIVKPVNLYLDAEWYNLSGTRNCVLSYQWSCCIDGVVLVFYQTYLDFPDRVFHGSQFRVSFSTALSAVVHWLIVHGYVPYDLLPSTFSKGDIYDKGIKVSIDGVVTPSLHVNIITHYGLGDLSSFHRASGVYDPISMVSAVSGGYASLRSSSLLSPGLPGGKILYCINYRDSITYAPQGACSLKALGDSIGFPKVELPEGYISNMDSLITENPGLFCAYAMGDPLVSMLYTSNIFGVNVPLPVTLSAHACKTVVDKAVNMYYGDKPTFYRDYAGKVDCSKGLALDEGERGELVVRDNENKVYVSDECRWFMDMCSEAYQGGYNQCDIVGWLKDTTYDSDLKSAYIVALAMVYALDIDVDRPGSGFSVLPWHNYILKPTDIQDPLLPIVAKVHFEFPRGTRNPCIPVVYDGSLIYPRTGEGIYVTAPALYTAVRMGAKITVITAMQASYTPHDTDTGYNFLGSIVQDMLLEREEAKNLYGKGSPQELAAKLSVVSVYGKIAQGIKGKRAFNARTGQMETVPPSTITNPYYASFLTDIVRCLMCILSSSISSRGHQVISATTDGLISTEPLGDTLRLTKHELLERYVGTVHALYGADTAPLEVKHTQDELLSVCTRGNVAPTVGGVCAHNGYKTGAESDSLEDRDIYITSVLTRTGSLDTAGVQKPSLRDFYKDKSRDLVMQDDTRSISMDYDYKRKPLIDTAHYVEATHNGKVYKVLTYNTMPYDTIDDYIVYKRVARSYEVINTIETLTEIEHQADTTLMGLRTYRRKGESRIRYQLRNYIMGWANGQWKIPIFDDLNKADIARLLTMLDIDGEITHQDIRNWTKKSRKKQAPPLHMLQDIHVKIRSLDPVIVQSLLNQSE